MCLIIAASRVRSDAPLVIAANRDELYARPAAPASRLLDDPVTIGGRDELAGGTWLAANAHGVVAALTNQSGPARDPNKRSRGELPLLAARHRTARAAADALAQLPDAAAYNACCLLVGDREMLFYVELLTAGRPHVEALPSGVHVLENRPLHHTSAKAELVRARASNIGAWPAHSLGARATTILSSTDRPPVTPGTPATNRPAALEAALVRTEVYGTRCASLVVVAPSGPPRFWMSDGPPDQAPLREVSALFG